MEAPPDTKNSNVSTVTTERSTKAKGKEHDFEFCKVCKLNHNQGRRHNFFPNHVKSLSSFLSRFQAKLSDVRFFLKNPSLLRPEIASRNRFWCIFCDFDVTEHGSSFACEKGISHLASVDHLKNLKNFMWKHGGRMDSVDRFRVSEADLAKYEKKCASFKSQAASEQSRGPLIGPSNDIHHELKFDYVDNFDGSLIDSDNSGFPNDVLPLQNHTNEKYQVCNSDMSGGTATSSLYANHSNKSRENGVRSCLTEDYFHNGQEKTCLVYMEKTKANVEGNSTGLQKLTPIYSTVREADAGNVHSGAPPPWFDSTNTIHHDLSQKPGQGMDPVVKNAKSKLNPKRVGAAWAEKRKLEMEMERRGELPTNRFNADWLPNFGRVWQSGSRKDSRKEFEVEAKKPVKDESQPDSSLQLQPYVSKRMRREATE